MTVGESVLRLAGPLEFARRTENARRWLAFLGVVESSSPAMLVSLGTV